jgi:hypothetical protein
MLKICLSIICIFAWSQAQLANASGVAERFTIIGIISAGSKKADKSTVLLRDKSTGKNIVLKVGDQLPNDRSYVIKKITRKEITVGDSYTEIVLIPDKFSGTAIESSNVASSKDFDAPMFDGEGDFSYEGGAPGGALEDFESVPIVPAPEPAHDRRGARTKGKSNTYPEPPVPPSMVPPQKNYDDLDSQYYDEQF